MQKLPLIFASALFLFGARPLLADEVKLTTGLAQGETLNLALNADLTVKLAWSGVEGQTITSDGTLQSITVSSPTLTITSTTGSITSLYLQGNKISALDLTAAPSLTRLLAADNQLTEIDLSKCLQLETIDLQNNKLTALNASALPLLSEINLANNNVSGTSLKFNSSARPTSYVVPNNSMTSSPSATILRNARTIWVQGNQLKTLSLGQSSELHSLIASGNNVKTVTLRDMPRLNEIWLDNNKLTTLDLSKGSPKLYLLAADHNELTKITWDTSCKGTCQKVYVNNNALFVNSMPSARYGGKDLTINYEPQSDYEMDEETYELNIQLDWSSLLAKNGWGISSGVTYTLADNSGYTLVKGTDFTETNKKFTFLTAHAGVTLTATTTNYTFRTAPFNIGMTEAISNAMTSQDAQPVIFATSGQLTVSMPASAPLKIYNTAGLQITDTKATQGTHTYNLPTGIYIVNGKKVIVP